MKGWSVLSAKLANINSSGEGDVCEGFPIPGFLEVFFIAALLTLCRAGDDGGRAAGGEGKADLAAGARMKGAVREVNLQAGEREFHDGAPGELIA